VYRQWCLVISLIATVVVQRWLTGLDGLDTNRCVILNRYGLFYGGELFVLLFAAHIVVQPVVAGLLTFVVLCYRSERVAQHSCGTTMLIQFARRLTLVLDGYMRSGSPTSPFVPFNQVVRWDGTARGVMTPIGGGEDALFVSWYSFCSLFRFTVAFRTVFVRDERCSGALCLFGSVLIQFSWRRDGPGWRRRTVYHGDVCTALPHAYFIRFRAAGCWADWYHAGMFVR
jgi:hypothetical protein